MFSFTTLCLVLLRTGKLYAWANKEQSVLSMFNEAFTGLFLTFAYRYASEGHDIMTINTLSMDIETQANKIGLPTSIAKYINLTDEQALSKLKSVTKTDQRGYQVDTKSEIIKKPKPVKKEKKSIE